MPSAEPLDKSCVTDLTSREEVRAKIGPSPSEERMAIDAAVSSGTERTRALLEEIAGGRRGAQLRGQVAARKRGARREEIEEAFQEACLKAGRSCRGQSMGEVYTWLLKTTDSIVDDMRDRRKREVLVDHSASEFDTVDPSLAPPDEVLINREERAELDNLTLLILDRLDERARKVAVLHSHGLPRNEIARYLRITPRIVKRDVEGILETGREQLTRVAGSGCADGHRLVARYAFGLAVKRDARRAQLHLATCTRCGSMFERLELWRECVAALVPAPPAVVEAHTHIAERVVHIGSDVFSSRPAQAPRPGLRQQAVHAIAHAREHAATAYYRMADPTPLAGARPGALAAAVAGCLAVGGGATYCVQQSADPIAAFTGLARTTHHKHKSTPHGKRARAAQVETSPATTPTITTPPPQTQTVQMPQPQAPVTTTTTSTSPPAPEDQFEPTSGSAADQIPTETTRAKSKQPASTPASGPGEFDGP